jgi:hypothetical protein
MKLLSCPAPSELYALLAAQKLLEDAQPGLLDSELAPLKRRIEKLLTSELSLLAVT